MEDFYEGYLYDPHDGRTYNKTAFDDRETAMKCVCLDVQLRAGKEFSIDDFHQVNDRVWKITEHDGTHGVVVRPYIHTSVNDWADGLSDASKESIGR